MRNHIYKISRLLLIILLVASCGNQKEIEEIKELIKKRELAEKNELAERKELAEKKKLAERKKFAEKDKTILDELTKLSPKGSDHFTKNFREDLERTALVIEDPVAGMRKLALEETNERIENQERRIENIRNQIEAYSNRDFLYPYNKAELEADLQYNEKFLELYKCRQEYTKRCIQDTEQEE
jgi:hypothetical protein